MGTEEEAIKPICKSCGVTDHTIPDVGKGSNLNLCYNCIRLKIQELKKNLNATLNEERKELLRQLLAAMDYKCSYSIMMD